MIAKVRKHGQVRWSMRIPTLLLIPCFLASCGVRQSDVTSAAKPRLATAERFIDAFYSFDQVRLRKAMVSAPASMLDILYYQQWAEAGHYVVMKRPPCRFDKADEASCPVTVKDDLVPALGSTYNVTDIFHFAFRDGRIVKVWNSSDDPPEFHLAMEWLRRERPEVFTGPCLGMFEGGPTPKRCVGAIIKGFAEFTSRR